MCLLALLTPGNAQAKEEPLSRKADEVHIENSTTGDTQSLKAGDKHNQQRTLELRQQPAAKNESVLRSSPSAKDECTRGFTKVVIPAGKGPTIKLDYGKGHSQNAIDDFMYFIPLISPALVDSRPSQGNRQTARVTSFKTKCRKARFSVVCEFEIYGTGCLITRYDPASIIAKYASDTRAKYRPV
jgi:hypothetical protein